MSKMNSILVVEDDSATQILYSALLSDHYTIYMSSSALEAKKQLKDHTVDLVILDLSLQGEEDGLNLMHYIRNSKKHKNVSVLAVTAHAFMYDRKRCLEAGCDDFLTKPIRGELLKQKIIEYLN
jgi:CheY-like chemotaxis protein